jgi:uncharacterized protein YuzE
MAQAEFDREADALYIRIRDTARDRTVELDDYRIVDFDADGNVVGLEVLYPDAHLDIAPIARQLGFADQLAEIDEAVAAALGGALPVAKVTVSIAYRLPVMTTEDLARDIVGRSIATSAQPSVVTHE